MSSIRSFITVVFLVSIMYNDSGMISNAFLSKHAMPSFRCQRALYSQLRQPDFISSTKSNTVKKIQSLLKRPKKRSEIGQTVVEGPRMVFDLLENHSTRNLVRQVVVSEDKSDWATELLSKYEHLHVCQGTHDVLGAISDTVTPQGIVACVEIPSFDHISKTRNSTLLYLVLDGVSDPGNVGTLLRSSLAVGVSAVILLPGCCDVWSPKAIRSAMGCSFQIPIKSANSLHDALQLIGIEDQNSYAATMDISDGVPSKPYDLVGWDKSDSALIIGSEGNGLSHEVRDAVAAGKVGAVHVPMQEGIESLNAAVCGSVILFEYQRQCRTSMTQ
mmetsp:Transcript_32050/g.48738  ORF Transcript_32050/g.48738 Transcript_32050/m.48738 type:complete len:330 (-) Transcript_32050:114-1103(-)